LRRLGKRRREAGGLLARGKPRDGFFVATKLWTARVAEVGREMKVHEGLAVSRDQERTIRPVFAIAPHGIELI